MILRPLALACALLTVNACSDATGEGDSHDRRDRNLNDPAAPRPGEDRSASPTDEKRPSSSYLPTVTPPFNELFADLSAKKPEVMAKQESLLKSRYDLSDRGDGSSKMFRGKAIQVGVRVRLPEGQTWESLSKMTPGEIRQQNLFPEGFLPLPHVSTEQDGQVFHQCFIKALKDATSRDLERFDVDFDLPEHFLPEFPPPIFLTSRPDLGDVSQGQLVTQFNFFELFNGVVTPRDLDGLRLLVSPFPQQQFNLTDDRRSKHPSTGVACFDCHANGHTNAAFHLDPQTRPQAFRRRVDTPSLRGVNIQRLFGSQRALKTVEDFTQFEQIGAYFDGDHVTAAKKGMNLLDRSMQVAVMAQFQNLLDFPPAPKLGIDGKLDPDLASAAELRGQELFFGKAQCSTCHAAPYYTDNQMHDLKPERFFQPRMINGRQAGPVGPIKTFPLRGIKETPPYLHDGRLLTLADTVEFFNLVLELKLTAQEKDDLVTFMMAL